MVVKNIELTLLKLVKKEGVGKRSGKEYLFYNASVVDADANVFGFILDDRAISDPKRLSDLLSAKNVSARADIRFSPKGFDVAGTILSIEIK